MGLTRRAALLGLGSAMALGRAGLALAAAPTDRRLVVVLLRGGMDGLAVVVPHGDPALATSRPSLVPAGLRDLGGYWGLHPALAGLHDLYTRGELLAVQAVAGPDRSRSHFEAQDALELGGAPGIASGWLNRAAGALAVPAAAAPALAVGAGTPLLLRGPTQVTSWLPEGGTHVPPDYYASVLALYRADGLGAGLQRALTARGFSEAVLAGGAPAPNRLGFPALCEAAGRLLAAADGPRIAALELDGWDTHVEQGPRLARALGTLDEGLTALRRGLDAAWRHCAVLVVTEFGRTVRANGGKGTDHGTASLAFVLGGGVQGGRVLGHWPGLAPRNLFENRDLQPTTDVRALAKGVLMRHLGLDAAALARVFPGSGAAPATPDLFHA